MRWYFRVFALATVLALAVAELSTAQQPPFGTGKGSSNPAALLQNDSVKKELKLTDEQLAKIPDAVLKALADVLDADQLKRLKQIDLQLKGNTAFADPGVQTTLKLNDEQKDNVKVILADAAKDAKAVQAAAFKDFKGGGGIQAMQEKMAAITKEAQERCVSILNADQKRLWQEMVGEDFKLEQPKFDFKGKGK